jgi:predicted Zn-dependent protease
VRLNNFTARTSTQTRKTSCHELGHVLGLAHRSTNTSCMTQGAALPIVGTTDTHDFDELFSLYHHAN